MCEQIPSGHANVSDTDLLTFYHTSDSGDIAVGSQVQWTMNAQKRLPVIAVYIAWSLLPPPAIKCRAAGMYIPTMHHLS